MPLEANSLKELLQTTASHFYQLQQQTLNKHLATLCNVSPELVPMLRNWAKLGKKKEGGDLLQMLMDFIQSLIKDEKSILVDRLKRLQRFAFILQRLSLSLEEVRSLSGTPGYYRFSNSGSELNLADIWSLHRFKEMVHEFQDSQNLILSYFAGVKEKPKDIRKHAKMLSTLSKWDRNEIEFLIKKFWSKSKEEVRQWGTVWGIDLLSNWFRKKASLQLDIHTISQIENLSAKGNASYTNFDSAANALWNSFATTYSTEPDKLKKPQGRLNELKRSAMLGLVIHKLATGKDTEDLNIHTADDLSGFLLIDVAVSGVVETSYVREAMSAVQLYINRCRNNLEVGIEHIEPELHSRWEWMEKYRVWQANREVFLYPENYIKPELRKHKSPQFAQLESELQQAEVTDLTNVNRTFNIYMNGFALVADMELVGAGVHDRDIANEEHSKELLLIAHTHQNPCSYHYMIGRFMRNEYLYTGEECRYAPVQWDYWLEMSKEMRPIAQPSPVYAFGKWFVFWVEKQMTGAQEKAQKSNDPNAEAKPSFSKIIKYSYLDFNKNWVAAQVLATIPNGVDDVVYPTYSASANLIAVNYDIKTGKSKLGLLRSVVQYPNLTGFNVEHENKVWGVGSDQAVNNQRTLIIKIAQPSSQKTVVVNLSNKTVTIDNKPVEPDKTIAVFNQEGAITDCQRFTISGGTFEKEILCAFPFCSARPIKQGIPLLDLPLLKNEPNQPSKFYFQYYSQFEQKLLCSQPHSFSTWFRLNDLPSGTGKGPIITCVEKDKETNGVSIDSKGRICVGQFEITPKEPIFPNQWYHILINKAPIPVTRKTGQGIDSAKDETPACVLFHKDVYIAWTDNEKKLNLGILDVVNGTVRDKKSLNKTCLREPSLTVHKGQIYIAWISYEPGDLANGFLNVGSIDTKGVLKSEQILTEKLYSQIPGLASLDGKLCISWFNSKEDKKIFYRKYKNLSETPATFQLKNVETERSASLCAYKGKLLIAWRDMAANLGVGYIEEDRAEGILKQQFKVDGASFPTLIACYNQLSISWLARKAGNNEKKIRDNELYISYGTLKLEDTGFTLDKTPETQIACPSVRGFAVGLQPYLMGNDNDKVFFTPCNHNIYLNGSPTGFANFIFTQNMKLGQSEAGVFDGTMHDTLFIDRILTKAEMKATFESSKGQITEDIEPFIAQEDAFRSQVTKRQVLNQPNWYLVKKKGATFLSLPYTVEKETKMDCTRLNSTAVQILSKRLMQLEIEGLLTVRSQMAAEIPFWELLPIISNVPKKSWPSDTIDFLKGPMKNYYWEVFFYAPFLLAQGLQSQQQFAAAKMWYEFIFNPTIGDNDAELELDSKTLNDKYWRFLGLRSHHNHLLKKELFLSFAEKLKTDLESAGQRHEYYKNPFDPHAIAGLRPIAYQKTMVMHYMDNLFSWGDNLYRQYTVETIVEATMLYILTLNLFGKEPINIGPCPLPDPQTFTEIVEQEWISFFSELEQIMEDIPVLGTKATPHNFLPDLPFGIPENSQFISYRAKVQQRLFNIRNGLNIDGVRQKLALFDPRIDPMQIVQQAASGTSVSSALSSLTVAIPFYRFNTMIEKAKDVTQMVVQFGQSLLGALEKKDAEAMALLQSTNQQNILALTNSSKEGQVEEVGKQIKGMEESLKSAEERLKHYTKLIGKGKSSNENSQVTSQNIALGLQTVALVPKGAATLAYLLPNIFGLALGGMKWGDSVNQLAIFMDSLAGVANGSAGLYGLHAGFERRQEDWDLQKALAQHDVSQIQSQIEASKLNKLIAQNEVAILKQNVDQEQKVEKFLKGKFTNQQLYQWIQDRNLLFWGFFSGVLLSGFWGYEAPKTTQKNTWGCMLYRW